MERTLERRQFRVMPFRDVKAVDGFDLAALDRTWCSEPMQPPATGPQHGGDAGPNDAGHREAGQREAGQRAAAQRDAPMPGPHRDAPDAEPAPRETPKPGSPGQARPVLAPASQDTGPPGTTPSTRSTAREDAPPAQPQIRPSAQPETNPAAQPQTSEPTAPPHQPDPLSDTTARRGRDAVPTYGVPAGSEVTRLEEGPGWTLDVIRRATPSGAGTNKAAHGTAPGSAS
jgi:hypothetical protein